MKRITLVLLAVLMAGVCWAAAIPPYEGVPANTILRICDGIGWQYKCVSSSIANQYGFGGYGDTLTSDSTVSRGTLMNIKRIKEGTDASLSELLPIFISSRTQLDSSYMYTKWSSVIWGINNFYSSVGGLSAKITAMADSGRLSPYFARVARANGVYLSNKTVYPPQMNFGSATLIANHTFTYSDSFNVDSTLYGPVGQGEFIWALSGATGNAIGECSLKVFGANQNLIHERVWVSRVANADPPGNTYLFTSQIANDSIYAIDSVKAFSITDTITGTFKFISNNERVDSL